MRRSLAACGIFVLAGFAGQAAAQVDRAARGDATTEAPPTTDVQPTETGILPTDSLTLRPEAEFASIAARAARILARRTGIEVRVGDIPPRLLLEAVPAAHVAIGRRENRLALILGGARGIVYATEIDLPRRQNESFARELALVLESLRDSALEPTPPPTPTPAETPAPNANARPRPATTTRWRIVERPIAEGGEAWGGRATRQAIAKPSIYLRLLIGVSTVRATPLLGIGTGLGLCLGRNCVVFDAEIPLLSESRVIDGFPVEYRAFSFATRFQYRPWEFGAFTPGFTGGVVMRVGSAHVPGSSGSATTTSNVGVRVTTELAWRFQRLFELVVEGGIDYAIDRSTFVNRAGSVLLIEDRWTPWAATSVRMRP